ncbi:MAG: dienelactone hydrolase family protein [Parachlamydiaceae bacterium]|nr:dienelactone hydrolase family protein [Parachlamydiaceae bacterium]
MHEEAITYSIDDKKFVGILVSPDKNNKIKRPAVIVAHAWMGRDEFAVQKARELAALGYIGFAADLYGDAQVVNTSEAAVALLTPLALDRATLQKRIGAAFNTISQNVFVDSKKIGGIGFCFGGLTIIELLRSGLPVRGVASFHAVLGTQRGEQKAKTVPIAKNIKGSLLILHGYNDPLVSEQDVLNTQKEMDDAKVDWQMNTYGHTSHGFMNPQLNDVTNGLIYNPQACNRAWRAMCNFFEEIFAN